LTAKTLTEIDQSKSADTFLSDTVEIKQFVSSTGLIGSSGTSLLFSFLTGIVALEMLYHA
jgi:hypothetical protein